MDPPGRRHRRGQPAARDPVLAHPAAADPGGGCRLGEGVTRPLVAVAAADVATGRVILDQQADVACYAASTLKLAILVALHRAAERGRLSLDQQVPVATSWPAAGGGDFALVADDDDPELASRAGEHVPVRDLAEHMITRSSNIGANVVLDLVGFEAVTVTLSALDATGCRLHHRFGDRQARAAGPANTVTAAGLAVLAAAVGGGRAATPDASREMLGVLAHQEQRDLIPAALP
ncbi:serine hydrolase, partial [Acidimicrobiaceae bacterium USS-CC1]|nr:serine hydrolase [Acidiferrimicrobium australe]